MSQSCIYRYSGKDIDVTWDERLCIHIGECGRAKGDLHCGIGVFARGIRGLF